MNLDPNLWVERKLDVMNELEIIKTDVSKNTKPGCQVKLFILAVLIVFCMKFPFLLKFLQKINNLIYELDQN